MRNLEYNIEGELTFGVAFTLEVWNEIHLRQRHQNRSKRRRCHRIKQRIEQLKTLDKRQHLINRLQETLGSDAALASEILKAEAIREKWFDSHSYGKLPRLDYLIDPSKTIAQISTKSAAPATTTS